MSERIEENLKDLVKKGKDEINKNINELKKLEIYNTWDNNNGLIDNIFKNYFNINKKDMDDIYYYTYEHFDNIKSTIKDILSESKDTIIKVLDDIIGVINYYYVNFNSDFLIENIRTLKISIVFIILFLFFGLLIKNYGYIKSDINNFENIISKFFYKEEKNIKKMFVKYEKKIKNIFKNI